MECPKQYPKFANPRLPRWEHVRAFFKATYAKLRVDQNRRFVLQQNGNPQRGAGEVDAQADPVQRAPLGVSDGKGCMFVSHIGQIFPSGFLPIEAGRFPRDSVVDVYQNAPLFMELRDPDGFGGKCGRCEFRHICGGSRARAYAVTGDYMAAEPDCVYQPAEPRD